MYLIRSVIKTLFETGDIPTQSQYSDVFDSLFIKGDDAGLGDFSSTRPYKQGEGAFINDALYRANADLNPGVLNMAQWTLVTLGGDRFSFPPYDATLSYDAGDRVSYQLKLWQVQSGHTAPVGALPSSFSPYWEELSANNTLMGAYQSQLYKGQDIAIDADLRILRALGSPSTTVDCTQDATPDPTKWEVIAPRFPYWYNGGIEYAAGATASGNITIQPGGILHVPDFQYTMTLSDTLTYYDTGMMTPGQLIRVIDGITASKDVIIRVESDSTFEKFAYSVADQVVGYYDPLTRAFVQLTGGSGGGSASATPSLQAVLDTGNTSTTRLVLYPPANGGTTDGFIEFFDPDGSVLLSGGSNAGAHPRLKVSSDPTFGVDYGFTFDGVALTGQRTFQLPDQDGTIALISDIGGGGGSGINSVTGDAVDNSDPLNPVVNAVAKDGTTNTGYINLSGQGVSSGFSFAAANQWGGAIALDSENARLVFMNGTDSSGWSFIDVSSGIVQRNGGIAYAADYSASFTDRHLVDKAYVLSVVGSGGGTGSGGAYVPLTGTTTVSPLTGQLYFAAGTDGYTRFFSGGSTVSGVRAYLTDDGFFNIDNGSVDNVDFPYQSQIQTGPSSAFLYVQDNLSNSAYVNVNTSNLSLQVYDAATGAQNGLTMYATYTLMAKDLNIYNPANTRVSVGDLDHGVFVTYDNDFQFIDFTNNGENTIRFEAGAINIKPLGASDFSSIRANNLTAGQTLNLPDASGTFLLSAIDCTLSDLPYQGGTNPKYQVVGQWYRVTDATDPGGNELYVMQMNNISAGVFPPSLFALYASDDGILSRYGIYHQNDGTFEPFNAGFVDVSKADFLQVGGTIGNPGTIYRINDVSLHGDYLYIYYTGTSAGVVPCWTNNATSDLITSGDYQGWYEFSTNSVITLKEYIGATSTQFIRSESINDSGTTLVTTDNQTVGFTDIVVPAGSFVPNGAGYIFRGVISLNLESLGASRIPYISLNIDNNEELTMMPSVSLPDNSSLTVYYEVSVFPTGTNNYSFVSSGTYQVDANAPAPFFCYDGSGVDFSNDWTLNFNINEFHGGHVRYSNRIVTRM